MAKDCLFCKIAAHEIDADVVHEREGLLAFRDLNPQAPVHVLLIPKQHLASASELTGEHGPLLAEMFEVMASIAQDESLSEGHRIVTNIGPDAGQSVDHLHFHLLGGRGLGWPPG
ncbi:MAG TPA: histidine triad nucleotide-binding protein [Actinomycetota bacterium]|nr:histidine triad nucleotide-binding protein [Actinomycetota bacterium]